MIADARMPSHTPIPTVSKKMRTAHGDLSVDNIARLLVIANCCHDDADDIKLQKQMRARFPSCISNSNSNEWERHRKGIVDTAGRTLCEMHPLLTTDFLLQAGAVDTAEAFLVLWRWRQASPNMPASRNGDVAFSYTYLDHSKLVRKLLGMVRILHETPSSNSHVDRGELASILNATERGRVRCKRLVALYREQLLIEGIRSSPLPHIDTTGNSPTFVGHAIV
jgi:hypothetical protein